MTASQSLRIFEILGRHFHNTKDARVVVEEIERIIEEKISDKKEVLATKEDMKAIELKIEETHTRIAETKADIISWVFAFFAALALLILGLYLRK